MSNSGSDPDYVPPDESEDDQSYNLTKYFQW